ncbi:MAG: SulP family inorganic anion transporter, partial [Actinomycetes bacterium]
MATLTERVRGKSGFLFPSMVGYRRSWLVRDAIAGITIAAIAIPGQIAVAKVAGMPPTTGLWACIAAGLVGFAFISNRYLWVGADSTTAPLVIAGLSVMAIPASEHYVQLAVTLALLVGAIFVVVAVAKMTWLADLLSRTVVVGFMAGVATIIVVGQLPALLGIPPGGTHTLSKLWHVLTNLGQINPVSATIGIVSLAALPLFTVLNRKLPGALLVVALATLATAALSLTRFQVDVLGPLQSGPPQ